MTTGEVLTLLVSVLGTAAAAVAAYFAWMTYGRRPKLKFYLQNEPCIMYDPGRSIAEVHCWLANVGATAAHNVHGWLQFGDDPTGVWPVEDEEAGVTGVADQYADVYLERLMPNRPRDAEDMAIDSPRLFAFPVEVFKTGRVALEYRFVCDEGAAVAGSLWLDFPDVTSS